MDLRCGLHRKWERNRGQGLSRQVRVPPLLKWETLVDDRVFQAWSSVILFGTFSFEIVIRHTSVDVVGYLSLVSRKTD